MDYLEKLKDPRWQKKRLKIFERDNWTCKSCSSKDKTLHIHHLFYLKNIEPWEINDGFLLTLCEQCHASSDDEYWSEGEVIIDDVGLFLNIIWASGFDVQDLSEIGLAISKIKRPSGPAIDCEFIAKTWEPPHAKD